LSLRLRHPRALVICLDKTPPLLKSAFLLNPQPEVGLTGVLTFHVLDRQTKCIKRLELSRRKAGVMRIQMRFGFFLLSVLAFAGCNELGALGDFGNYGSSNRNLVGEVRHIDNRAREIELRTDAGRTQSIRFDNQTKVLYRQRDYAVANLEPGDYVAMRTHQDRDGRLYTDQITVRESVQERSGTGRLGRLDRFEGTVELIDSRRGVFEVRDRQNRLVLVTLPSNAPRTVSDRFNRLREGDFVRIEGRFVNQERFELDSFA
jgi:hypothetical protein